jgi:hypothetical protein
MRRPILRLNSERVGHGNDRNSQPAAPHRERYAEANIPVVGREQVKVDATVALIDTYLRAT